MWGSPQLGQWGKIITSSPCRTSPASQRTSAPKLLIGTGIVLCGGVRRGEIWKNIQTQHPPHSEPPSVALRWALQHLLSGGGGNMVRLWPSKVLEAWDIRCDQAAWGKLHPKAKPFHAAESTGLTTGDLTDLYCFFEASEMLQ